MSNSAAILIALGVISLVGAYVALWVKVRNLESSLVVSNQKVIDSQIQAKVEASPLPSVIADLEKNIGPIADRPSPGVVPNTAANKPN